MLEDVLQDQIKELTATSTRTEKLALSLVYERDILHVTTTTTATTTYIIIITHNHATWLSLR